MAFVKDILKTRFSVFVISVPVLFLLSLFGEQRLLNTLIYAIVWSIYCIAFDMFTGYSGRLCLGFTVFPGLAAYVSGITTTQYGVNPWMGIILGVVAAGLLALLVGSVTLRLKGIYFAVSTCVVALVFYETTMLLSDMTGGEEGLWAIDPLFFNDIYNFYFGLVLLIIFSIFAIWYTNSKAGLILKAIKGAENTAKSLGQNTFKYLLISFILSAIIGGTAGGFLAHYQMYIGPEIFGVTNQLQVITFTMVGGMGTITGPFIGAFFLSIVNEYLRELGYIRLLLYFLLLIIVLRFYSEGLLKLIIRTARKLGTRKP